MPERELQTADHQTVILKMVNSELYVISAVKDGDVWRPVAVQLGYTNAVYGCELGERVSDPRLALVAGCAMALQRQAANEEAEIEYDDPF